MTDLQSKILSIKESLNVSYVKPDPNLVSKYSESLFTHPDALDYLHIGRGFSTETIINFKLGYDVDRNAITIPNYKRGELINIMYRHLDPGSTSKYTQEKGCEIWLYNEDGIEKGKAKGGVLLIEGQFDLMSAWQAGFKNVISVASGKESYGMWIELLDSIPKVYINFDNDKPGKSASLQLAERVGTEKCFEVLLPDGIKDANDYFKAHTAEEYKELIRKARPYYKYKYQGVKDVIDSIREHKDNILRLKCIPFVEWEEDWLGVMSGVTNSGKTSIAMNIADEIVSKGIPCLVLPIERGIRTVGKRFLQTRYNKTSDELVAFDNSDWDKIIPDIIELPLYFSMPSIQDAKETIIKAKRLFNTKVVIIDHLDLLVRKGGVENQNVATAEFIQNCKSIAQEYGIIFILVHHIRKQEGVGAIPKKPSLNDLKGSGTISTDPEVVIMLSVPNKGQLEINILKNKGEMGGKIFYFNTATGKIGEEVKDENGVVQNSLDNF